jgi:outer membrane receptor protein involved in Fe transport
MMKKMHRKKLSLAVAQALSAGICVGLAGPMAYAQPAPAPSPERIEKLTVTGSRLPVSPNLESTSPISIITAQDIKMENPVSIEHLLNAMPQVASDYGNNLANGATGTATVNLRGLGSARTLVLINGRRLPAGSPIFYATDINAIPLPLIQRVDIYTGGASAVYGSDAVAGVVNFIMNDRFEGVQFDIGYSFFNHQQGNGLADVIAGRAAGNPQQFSVPGDVDHDGEVQTYSVTMGGNFANGKGNAVVFLGYEKQKPVLQGTRDYSACATGSNAAGFTCAGSGTSAPGSRFFNLATGDNFVTADTAGNLRPFTTNDQFNFAPYNHFQRPDERYLADFFAHYDVTPWARTYTEFQFHDDRTNAQIAPSGIFFGGPGSTQTLSFNNPLLSDAFKTSLGITATNPVDVLIGHRNQEGGGRVADLRHTSYRGVLGVKGDIPFMKGWDYDVWYQMGKVVYQQNYLNDFSGTRIGRALNVVPNPVPGGPPVCQSVVDGTDPACAPYDIFRLGGVTQAALNYLQTPGLQTGFTEQSVVGGTVSADLGMYGWRLPWAKDGIGVAFGAERRVEKIELVVDQAFATGDLAGQGGPTLPLNGRYTVKEAYAEVKVPIIQDQPWAQLLSVNGSYRYSDYDTGITTDTYGIGIEWAPVKEVRLRGSYQQAIRAANVIELFTPQGLTLFNMGADPCGLTSEGGPPTATLAQCVNSGLTAAQYGSTLLTNPAGQYNQLQGGNPALNPEKAKTYTLGVVVQPMRNFNITVDYWQIKLDNAISIVPSDLALDQCLNANSLCNLIHRDPGTGSLWLNQGFVTGTNVNLSKIKTSGVDITANYNQPLGAWGNLGLNFVGSWLEKFVVEPIPGLGDYDCAGFFGPTCGSTSIGVAPEWKHRLRGSWSTPWNVDVSATWRHVDKVKLEQTSSNPLLAGAFNPVDTELGARDYFDLAAMWAITKQFSLYFGVQNVFDKDPPITNSNNAGAPFGSGNTFPQMYDALGRRIFISLSAKF